MNALQPEIVIVKICFFTSSHPGQECSARMISKTVPEKYQQQTDQPIGGEA